MTAMMMRIALIGGSRIEPEEEDEDERADYRPHAEPDAAGADAERDEGDDDEP